MNQTDRENQKIKRLIRSLGCSVWPQWGPNGNCPIQAEGRIALPNRKPVQYYLRARGETIRMGFHSKNPLFDEKSFNFEVKLHEKYSAGWVAEHYILNFITEAVQAWKKAPHRKESHG